MNPFFREVDRLEEEVMPLARTLRARTRRFFIAFVPLFILAVLAVPNLTVGVLLSTALSVAVTVIGELDPGIPVSALIKKFDTARWRDPVVTPQVKGNQR